MFQCARHQARWGVPPADLEGWRGAFRRKNWASMKEVGNDYGDETFKGGVTQQKRTGMPKDAHNKAAEHHENAARSHRTAAEHHGKGDHAKGREESSKAHGHSKTAHEHSETAHGKSQAQK
jgi:hypothetical protein